MTEMMSERELPRDPGDPPPGAPIVRTLAAADAERVARIDEHLTGRPRREFFRKKIERAIGDADVSLSLAAEVDDSIAGFVIASVDFGEFGRTEPVAVLDAIGVDPTRRSAGVGSALLEQLARNLRALSIERVRTEVDWRQWELLRFFQKSGFKPAARLCLEASVSDIPTEPAE